MKASLLRIALTVALVVTGAYAFRGPLFSLFFGPGTPPPPHTGLRLGEIPAQAIAIVADGLEVPWEIAFLPDGTLLVTERPGRLVHLAGQRRRVYPIEGVRHGGEGGLMGLALHPRFQETRWIYVSLTADGTSGPENRVERYRFSGGTLTDRTVILDGIPAARFHDGGRVAFGPDGYLYITTGDATNSSLAQDTRSLAGKILRLTDDGRTPADNPFSNPVYSYGHRNPQGLAWDDRARLWSTEHGRSGLESGMDELNLVEKGQNYGWPAVEGDETAVGMVGPVLHSGPDHTWAPAGAAFLDGSVFFGGLRGEALYEARVSETGEGRSPDLRVHLHRDFGRIRVVRRGPDGMLYLATSNRDGRGRARDGDDRILRVNPAVFR
ncbi:MAG: PQQ-dependent sugar dehydrogenase [Gemmatimonadetes bacterium]|nr:PQQ-dependent sugar dehydrogenase [Gemmatimonadota bacterium]